MTRIAFQLILVCVVAGATFHFFCLWSNNLKKEQQQKELAKNVAQKAYVSFAIRDIQKGESFNAGNVEDRLIPMLLIAQDSILSSQILVERHAGRTIPKGRQLGRGDIAASDRRKWTRFDRLRLPPSTKEVTWIVYPGADIPAGEPIEPLVLEQIGSKSLKRKIEIPKGAITSAAQTEGKIARNDIAQGQIIAEKDLRP